MDNGPRTTVSGEQSPRTPRRRSPAFIVRMQHHAPTKAYVARRIAEGKSKTEIIRCLKRLLAREIWALMRPLRTTPSTLEAAA
jgi:hypothetical protein